MFKFKVKRVRPKSIVMVLAIDFSDKKMTNGSLSSTLTGDRGQPADGTDKSSKDVQP